MKNANVCYFQRCNIRCFVWSNMWPGFSNMLNQNLKDVTNHHAFLCTWIIVNQTWRAPWNTKSFLLHLLQCRSDHLIPDKGCIYRSEVTVWRQRPLHSPRLCTKEPSSRGLCWKSLLFHCKLRNQLAIHDRYCNFTLAYIRCSHSTQYIQTGLGLGSWCFFYEYPR